MNEAPAMPSDPSDERLLELLAEVELLRRKTRLLDARLAQWESRLDDACAVVDGLLGAIDDSPDPEARLRSLEVRIQRLDRRRTAPAALAERPAPASHPRMAAPAAPPIPDAIAIVFARWLVGGEPADTPVTAGAAVELVADVDGIPPETAVAIEVHPLDAATAVARLEAKSDGHQIAAKWTIPESCAGRGWSFTARFEKASSTAPPLYVD